jgi:hypothetical protein
VIPASDVSSSRDAVNEPDEDGVASVPQAAVEVCSWDERFSGGYIRFNAAPPCRNDSYGRATMVVDAVGRQSGKMPALNSPPVRFG